MCSVGGRLLHLIFCISGSMDLLSPSAAAGVLSSLFVAPEQHALVLPLPRPLPSLMSGGLAPCPVPISGPLPLATSALRARRLYFEHVQLFPIEVSLRSVGE